MSQSSPSPSPSAPAQSLSVRNLILLSIPALVIGAGSAVVLWLLDLASEWLMGLLWDTLPGLFGATSSTPWWIVVVLTVIGLAVGLVVQFVPGHAGPDSATTELAGAPPKIVTVPSLLIVVLLGLAGGVSLGPENPIIAINSALAVTIVARMTSKIPAQLIVLLAAAATIGALFGTPVAGALVLPGMVAAVTGGGSLWDKLFLPLVAGGAGAVTMLLLGGNPIAFHLEPMGAFEPGYLLWGTVVAVVAAVIVILASVLFRFVHRAFHALRHPVIFTTLGGLVLGILGAVGTPETMFKGLDQAAQLLTHPDDYSASQLTLFVVIKLLALVVAASAGFRGRAHLPDRLHLGRVRPAHRGAVPRDPRLARRRERGDGHGPRGDAGRVDRDVRRDRPGGRRVRAADPVPHDPSHVAGRDACARAAHPPAGG